LGTARADLFREPVQRTVALLPHLGRRTVGATKLAGAKAVAFEPARESQRCPGMARERAVLGPGQCHARIELPERVHGSEPRFGCHRVTSSSHPERAARRYQAGSEGLMARDQRVAHRARARTLTRAAKRALARCEEIIADGPRN